MTQRDSSPQANDPWSPPAQQHNPERRKLSRRGWTIVLSTVVLTVFVVVGMVVPIPYVALGPGPTYDTLADSGDRDVVMFNESGGRGESDVETYEPSGQLRLTTVSVTENVTLFHGMGMWLSGRYAMAPREQYFPPGETDEEVREKNVRQFEDSQGAADVAALRYLDDTDAPVAEDIDKQVMVKSADPDGPSATKLDAGDELLTVGDQPVDSAQGVRDALNGTAPGETIDVEFERDGNLEETEIELGEAADDRDAGFMGIEPVDSADAGFEADIELEDVGGPSAGLMFSLAIIDRLTEQDLTSGEHIAGTGEVNETGVVGPIGGITFKLVAAREEGATVFLVPAANCTEAVADPPDGLKLVKVGTVADAAEALQDLDDAPTC